MRIQDPKKRIKNFNEVELGYNASEAVGEASRCLNCKDPKCVLGCPVNIDIPGFIQAIKAKETTKALEILHESNNLPGICGRVCPQEIQCQEACVLNKAKKPISIGRLERYAADNAKRKRIKITLKKGKKVAVVGSGPGGLTCAADLAKMGYDVTIFEALGKPGGVLEYGIPSFRLPKDIIKEEVDAIKKLGVKIEYNAVISRTITLAQLKKKFSAIFLGVGAGLPRFLGIPGENKCGVVTANEFLTRVNLMKAYRYPKYETPVRIGKRTIVVGGGNVAMDSARCARRLGSKVTVVYRRSFEELPARRDEVEHTKEEGIKFMFLTNPVNIVGKQYVTGVYCVQMMLGEPDDSGRRRPIPIENSEFKIETDQIIIAIGREPNKLILKNSGLRHDIKGKLRVKENMQTSDPQIFAGGDIVSGESTVISAMGQGKIAAMSIDEFLSK